MSVETITPQVLEAATASSVRQSPLALRPTVDRWTASRLLRRAARPLALRQPALERALEPGKLRPVLVPAWRLDLELHSRWSCGDERSGTRSRRCSGVIAPAVLGELARVVESACSAPEPAVEVPAEELADWSPLGVTRPLAAAWSAACAHLSETAVEEAALGLSLEETESLRVETRFEEGSARALLVPAWKMRVRAGGRSRTVFVEACTGRVVGALPWNARKLTAAAAIAGTALGLAAVLLAL